MYFINKFVLCESTSTIIFYEIINSNTAEVNGDFDVNSTDYIARLKLVGKSTSTFCFSHNHQ